MISYCLLETNKEITAELLNIKTGETLALIPMLQKREFHQAILLEDSRVLIIGGYYTETKECEIFNPVSYTFEKIFKLGIEVNCPM